MYEYENICYKHCPNGTIDKNNQNNKKCEAIIPLPIPILSEPTISNFISTNVPSEESNNKETAIITSILKTIQMKILKLFILLFLRLMKMNIFLLKMLLQMKFMK